jgi:hypothetical protein
VNEFRVVAGQNGQEREGKGWRGLLYPLIQKRVVTALRPGISGKTPETLGSPETPASQGQHPKSQPYERVGAKVSLIGFV